MNIRCDVPRYHSYVHTVVSLSYLTVVVWAVAFWAAGDRATAEALFLSAATLAVPGVINVYYWVLERKQCACYRHVGVSS